MRPGKACWRRIRLGLVGLLLGLLGTANASCRATDSARGSDTRAPTQLTTPAAAGSAQPSAADAIPTTAGPAAPAPTSGSQVSAGAMAKQLDDTLADRDWRRINSRRQGLEFALPSRATWRINDTATPWLVAQHAASHSQLIARLWRAPARVTAEDCERDARLWRPTLPHLSSAQLLSERYVAAPRGFHTKLRIGIVQRESGRTGANQNSTDSNVGNASPRLQGYALAFGATPGRCFSLAFTTRDRDGARESHTRRVIAERLSLVTEGVLASVRLVEIDRRVQRQTPTTPATPATRGRPQL